MLARALGRRVFAGIVFFAPAIAAGQQQPRGPQPLPAPATYQVSRAASSIKVDGVLDENAWQHAVDVPVAWEWSPGENVPAPVRTQCLVTYDDRNLYVAFRALDPRPSEIRAHLMDRDDTDTLIQDDHVGVMIDTFNDERRAFQFRINPLGVQADAIFSEQDGVEDFSWDMIWDAAGRTTDEGYVIEIALPLKQLRFQAGSAAQTWGFEAFRSWPRNVRHRLSSQPRDRNKGCLLCQENKIAGLEGLTQGRNVELDPTATANRTDTRGSTSAGLASGDVEGELGLTARWSVTPNLTLNGTVNPDFSQVEADVAQLDVNQRFALYYPEKRPFFLEGIDFFTTPIQAVFTRTVADPTFGAKLTGKQGANAVGVFVTRDRLNNLLLPANQGSDNTTAPGEATTVVGRYRRDVGKGSTVGALYAGREGTDYFNRQAGLDVFWRLNASDSLRGQHIQVATRYAAAVSAAYAQPAGRFDGNGTSVEFDHQARNWLLFASYEAYSPGFRSDTGFVPRVDVRNASFQGQHRWWRGAGSWFNTLDLGIRGWNTTDWHWTLTDRTVAGFVNYTGPFQTQVVFNMPADVVVYRGVRYEYWRPNYYAAIKPNGNTSAQVEGRFGGGVDFANGRAATSVVQLSPSAEYRPTRRINLGFSHSFEELSIDAGRLYRANLSQLKLVYHLGVRTYVRAILQYTDISRDSDLYLTPVEPRTRRLFSQYLFSYKLNPQTVLFVGYSDNAVGDEANQLQRQNRTFFAKVGYAWIL
jgi:hypothetical protein